jgi:hypothetical protein
MKEALGSSETSVLTRATRRNIPEDIIHSIFFLAILWRHLAAFYTHNLKADKRLLPKSPYISTLNVEAVSSSETSVNLY